MISGKVNKLAEKQNKTTTESPTQYVKN